MALYLIDECIPHHIATALQVAGYNATSVRDALYSGASDPEIAKWCTKNGAVLVTKDYQLRRKKLHAAMLKQYQISVVFFREGKRHWQVRDWYFQIFRQINRLEQEFSSTRSPKYLVCRPTGKPESITL